MSAMSAKVLRIRELEAGFATKRGIVKAVDNVTLDLSEGEFLGIAGESGCGKSTLAYAILGLLEENGRIFSGEVIYKNTKLTSLSQRELRKIRWNRISMVFQSAMNALNPVLKVREQLMDVALTHQTRMNEKKAKERSVEMLELVDIAPDRLDAYPHQLSGGMRQRVMIAMALLLQPEVIIMDEPTTALDVVVQRTIIDKIEELRKQFGFSVIFITHDLSLLVEISDRLAIMYGGEIVEYGPSAMVYEKPGHPYTAGLMRSFPPLMGEMDRCGGIPGKPPNFLDLPQGCRFHPRCNQCQPVCTHLKPPDKFKSDGHRASCHFAGF